MKKYLYLLGFIVALLLSACSDVIEKEESDPITVIDDLDTSVTYEQLVNIQNDSLTWDVNVFKEGDNMTILFLGSANKCYYLLHMPFPSDSIFASGKYSGPSNLASEDRYDILVSSCKGKDSELIYFKKCQMYVTRTNISKDEYSIRLYMQCKDNKNEYIHHEGKIALKKGIKRY